jgi:hypothetical protein
MTPGWQPPYPSFVARFAPSVARVVMAYFGVQFRPGAEPGAGSGGEPPAIVRTVAAARDAGRRVGDLAKRTIGVTIRVEVTEPDAVERSLGKMRRIVDQRPAR